MVLDNQNAALGTAATPGSITTGNGQDLIFDVTANTLTVNSAIAPDGSSVSRPLTKAGTGTLVLANSTNSLGDVYVLAGVLQVNSVGAIGAGNTINLLGGTFSNNVGGATVANGGTNAVYAQNFVVGPTGGIIQNSSVVAEAMTLNGSISLNGRLTLHNTSTANFSQIALNGSISGPGDLNIRARRKHEPQHHGLERR